MFIIPIANFKTLKEWEKLGYKLKKDIKRPYAWTHPKGIPMYEAYQVETISRPTDFGTRSSKPGMEGSTPSRGSK